MLSTASHNSHSPKCACYLNKKKNLSAIQPQPADMKPSSLTTDSLRFVKVSNKGYFYPIPEFLNSVSFLHLLNMCLFLLISENRFLKIFVESASLFKHLGKNFAAHICLHIDYDSFLHTYTILVDSVCCLLYIFTN